MELYFTKQGERFTLFHKKEYRKHFDNINYNPVDNKHLKYLSEKHQKNLTLLIQNYKINVKEFGTNGDIYGLINHQDRHYYFIETDRHLIALAYEK